MDILEKYLGEAKQLKYKKTIGGFTANSSGYKVEISDDTRWGLGWSWEIWKGNKRVAKSKSSDQITNQYDAKTKAEKTLARLKGRKYTFTTYA